MTGLIRDSVKRRLKLWFITCALCFGSGLPFFCTLYVPNTAKNSMYSFLQRAIFLQNVNGTNGTQDALERSDFAMSLLWALFIAEMGMGQLVGYLFASPVLDRFGRQKCLLVTLICQIPALLFHTLSHTFACWPLLYVGRFVSMTIFAVQAVAVPVFLSEIAPAKVRGSLCTMWGLSLAIGALLGGALGLEDTLGNSELWPYTFLVPLLCTMSIIPLVAFIPETPQYLLARQLFQSSIKALNFYHGSYKYSESVMTDSKPAEDEEDDETSTKSMLNGSRRQSRQSRIHHFTVKAGHGAMWKLLGNSALRRPLFLTLVLSCAFCFSGILVIGAYSTAILEDAGMNDYTAEYSTVGLKVLSLLTFILCLFLVDRIGRRPLLLASSAGSAAAWSALLLCGPFINNRDLRSIFTVILLFIAQFFTNVGIRPLFFVLIPELFPYRFRTAAKSMAGVLGVFLSIPLLFGFFPLLTVAGNWVYLLLAIPLWACFVYLYKRCPETSRRLPHEIFEELKIAQMRESMSL